MRPENNVKPIVIDYPSTMDYDRFKYLKGNRKINPYHVAELKKSIQNGFIPNPVVINENWEIIDGQHRIKALKELGLPITYIVHSGGSIDDCVKMNTTSSQWQTCNYIDSFGDMGNDNYEKLSKLTERYLTKTLKNGNRKYSVPIKTMAAAGSKTVDAGDYQKYIRLGNFVFREDYEEAVKLCDYIHDLAPYFKGKGKLDVAGKILLFAQRCKEIDEQRLKRQIKKYSANDVMFTPFIAFTDCLKSLNDLYNYRLPQKVNFSLIYDEYIKEYGGNSGAAWANTRRKKGKIT